jgi:hypothetical protein
VTSRMSTTPELHGHSPACAQNPSGARGFQGFASHANGSRNCKLPWPNDLGLAQIRGDPIGRAKSRVLHGRVSSCRENSRLHRARGRAELLEFTSVLNVVRASNERRRDDDEWEKSNFQTAGARVAGSTIT